MDMRLMLTILKPAFSISARMALVCPLRTASGLTMLKVRWLKTLSWREICAISSVQAGGESRPALVQPNVRWTRWIWFVGCAAWVVDSAVSIHLHDAPHAKLAMMVAAVFLVAGMFYQAQKR